MERPRHDQKSNAAVGGTVLLPLESSNFRPQLFLDPVQ